MPFADFLDEFFAVDEELAEDVPYYPKDGTPTIIRAIPYADDDAATVGGMEFGNYSVVLHALADAAFSPKSGDVFELNDKRYIVSKVAPFEAEGRVVYLGGVEEPRA